MLPMTYILWKLFVLITLFNKTRLMVKVWINDFIRHYYVDYIAYMQPWMCFVIYLHYYISRCVQLYSNHHSHSHDPTHRTISVRSVTIDRQGDLKWITHLDVIQLCFCKLVTLIKIFWSSLCTVFIGEVHCFHLQSALLTVLIKFRFSNIWDKRIHTF